MWLWDNLNLLINSLKGDIIIQLDYLNPHELSSVIMLVSQNMDIKSLCDPVLRGYPVCEKEHRTRSLGTQPWAKLFNSSLSLSCQTDINTGSTTSTELLQSPRKIIQQESMK